ncbi:MULTISPECIES: hypothetical protein [Candidatus Ichthyocystis]|uniref:hypothetical protein n=1 Tax=Candidatus Ichthyocystis TaxID=2929841 RepID=UPI000B827134|nr:MULTISPECIES: hypothetical protein [Ichthyocystis]
MRCVKGSEEEVSLLLPDSDDQYGSIVQSSGALEGTDFVFVSDSGASLASPINSSHVLISIDDFSRTESTQVMSVLMVALGYVLRAEGREEGPTEEELSCISRLNEAVSDIFSAGACPQLSLDSLRSTLESNLLPELTGVSSIRDRVELMIEVFDKLHPGKISSFSEPTGNSLKRTLVKLYRFFRYSQNPLIRCCCQGIFVFMTHTCYEYFAYGVCLFLQRHSLDALTLCQKLYESIKRCLLYRHSHGQHLV